VFTVLYQHFGFSAEEDKYQHGRNLKRYMDETADLVSSCARARSSYNKEWKHDRAVELRTEALSYASFFSLPEPSIDPVPDLDSEQMAAIRAKEARASAKKAEITRKHQEEERIRWAQVAEQWRRGEYHHCLPYSMPTMLRIEGHELVSSIPHHSRQARLDSSPGCYGTR
jgi:hypothetical protein